MQELESVKAKKITIPRRAKRYGVAYYNTANGWQTNGEFSTTPETAMDSFLRRFQDYNKEDRYYPKYYSVFEVELELPIHLFN
jgi:hypothetical protein